MEVALPFMPPEAPPRAVEVADAGPVAPVAPTLLLPDVFPPAGATEVAEAVRAAGEGAANLYWPVAGSYTHPPVLGVVLVDDVAVAAAAAAVGCCCCCCWGTWGTELV